MKTEPTKEHQWLQKLVGDWTFEVDAPAGPDQPTVKLEGTETVRSIGGLWILGEGRGPMPDGTEATTLLTLGYDPAKGRFVGTWLGSMMAFLWAYDGELDDSKSKLSLHAEGPKMGPEGCEDKDKAEGGGMANYKDVIEFKNPDHRTLTAYLQGDDGQWTQIMAAHYRRRK